MGLTIKGKILTNPEDVDQTSSFLSSEMKFINNKIGQYCHSAFKKMKKYKVSEANKILEYTTPSDSKFIINLILRSPDFKKSKYVMAMHASDLNGNPGFLYIPGTDNNTYGVIKEYLFVNAHSLKRWVERSLKIESFGMDENIKLFLEADSNSTMIGGQIVVNYVSEEKIELCPSDIDDDSDIVEFQYYLCDANGAFICSKRESDSGGYGTIAHTYLSISEFDEMQKVVWDGIRTKDRSKLTNGKIFTSDQVNKNHLKIKL